MQGLLTGCIHHLIVLLKVDSDCSSCVLYNSFMEPKSQKMGLLILFINL